MLILLIPDQLECWILVDQMTFWWNHHTIFCHKTFLSIVQCIKSTTLWRFYRIYRMWFDFHWNMIQFSLFTYTECGICILLLWIWSMNFLLFTGYGMWILSLKMAYYRKWWIKCPSRISTPVPLSNNMHPLKYEVEIPYIWVYGFP